MFCNIQVQKRTWNGQPAYYVLLNDATSRIHQKISDNQGSEKTQQRKQAENFKATASHELRTPIKICIQMIETILEAYLARSKRDPMIKEAVKLLEMIMS